MQLFDNHLLQIFHSTWHSQKWCFRSNKESHLLFLKCHSKQSNPNSVVHKASKAAYLQTITRSWYFNAYNPYVSWIDIIPVCKKTTVWWSSWEQCNFPYQEYWWIPDHVWGKVFLTLLIQTALEFTRNPFYLFIYFGHRDGRWPF